MLSKCSVESSLCQEMCAAYSRSNVMSLMEEHFKEADSGTHPPAPLQTWSRTSEVRTKRTVVVITF